MQKELFMPSLKDFSAKELLAEYNIRTSREVKKISSPDDAFVLLNKYCNDKHESFFCIYLDGAHNIIATKMISKGILNKTIVHPREVFRYAVVMQCAGIVLAHNHPSGNINPSREDNELTERIQKAGEIMGISILDHVIISKNGYYSYLEDKRMEK